MNTFEHDPFKWRTLILSLALSLLVICIVWIISPPPANYAPPLNVQDFGATPNDTTDDREAIQAAIDSAGITGAEVHLPPGTYIINASLMFTKKSQNIDSITFRINGAHTYRALLNGGYKPENIFFDY